MMLANPVVVPMYAEPVVWGFAIVAMAAEVRTVLWLLRRMRRDVAGLAAPLFLTNLTTWLPFLVAVDSLPARSGLGLTLSIGGLELAVIVVETFLLRALCAGRLFARNPRCGTVTLRQALGLSFAGNLASIVTSMLLPWLFVGALAALH